MPKSKHRANYQFYEALATASPDLSGIFSSPRRRRKKLLTKKQRKQISKLALTFQGNSLAIAYDTKKYTGAIWQSLTGKSAQFIYRLAALVAISTAGVMATITAAATVKSFAGSLSDPSLILNRKNTGTTILDRNGQVLFEVYGANNIKQLNIKEIPDPVIKATLAAEDPHFYSHQGLSVRGTTRAIFRDITHQQALEGGSTITQQLVKNALLSPEKTLVRKYREIILALQIEKRYSKDQILQMYLNKTYYGQGSFGIESASQTYFHKSASELSVGEAALLAGLPLGPSRLDPNLNPEGAMSRRNFILSQMHGLGYITPQQYQSAKSEALLVHARQIKIAAPHFVFYVLDQLREIYGDELVEKGGITVYTTLDLTKHQLAERIVAEQVQKLKSRQVTNGGLVALDPTNGDILAMVGSSDYNQPIWGKFNVTTSLLQPGSTFKPIAYAAAFKEGYNGATVVNDKPLALPSGDGTLYRPVNYDGKFRGPVTLRRALSNSLNIPAIEVLRHAGIPDTLATAKDLGITSLNQPDRYGLSLVLGGGEVQALEMAGVFATFANSGIKVTPMAIMRVTDKSGKEITIARAAKPERVLDARIAYMLSDIMSDNNARQEIFGSNSPLKLSRPAAVKTGTTNDFRDNWTIGYTPQLATAVWVGNNDHSPMREVDGITGAAPIWNKFMEEAHRGLPPQAFIQPPGLSRVKVCTFDGGIANEWDTSTTNELFFDESKPKRRCASEAPKPKEEEKPKESDQPATIPQEQLPPSKPPEKDNELTL